MALFCWWVWFVPLPSVELQGPGSLLSDVQGTEVGVALEVEAAMVVGVVSVVEVGVAFPAELGVASSEEEAAFKDDVASLSPVYMFHSVGKEIHIYYGNCSVKRYESTDTITPPLSLQDELN